MNLFLDTSAFAKRYIAEAGSDKVIALCGAAEQIVVSVICLPELISTLSRLVREKRLSKADYRKLKSLATADLSEAKVCPLDAGVLVATTSLLEVHPIRAMDALHVACALAVSADKFASADQRQLGAAKKSGLAVLDVSGR